MKKTTFICLMLGIAASTQAQIPLVYNAENTGSQLSVPAMPKPDKLPVIRELPDPLEGVSTFADWERRRNTIATQIQTYGIGAKPAMKPGQVKARMSGDTLIVTVTVGKNSLTLRSEIQYPKVGKPPYAVMIGTSMIALPKRLFENRPIATMTFHEKQVNDYGQFGRHHERGEHPFDRLYPKLKENGAYSEWAWGLSRLIDGLQLLGPEVTKIDTEHIGLTGCSYAGKMALYCGAFDERVALTIAQEPGGGGAAAWRTSHELTLAGKNLEDIDKTDYHWFLESQKANFHGDSVYRLPYDQHELCAMVCPRALLLLGNPDYEWLADGSMLVSAQAARKVWDRFGISDRMGWSIVDGHGHCQLPERQDAEVLAFIDKFLLGRTTDTRDITTVSKKYDWQNPNLPTEQRVENLLGMLRPEEKVGLMMNKSVSVDRLGIPSYNWWSEACHGVRQGGYTVYPQPIGMAAAFNAQLVHDVFSQVSDEARANWNRSNHNVFNVPMGVTYYPGNPELTFWCPNVNIFRDPRWGRGQETCGEDPYMNAVLGVQTVLGMQGNDDRYFKTHACAKHYAVHSGPEPLRHSMNVEPSNRDLWETYLPAFKALVKKANVREVMCAYQRFEGKPCCASDRLLIDILRNKWGYDAIVLTDCDAINNFFNRGQHETHKDPLSATVDAVLNGTDLECGKVMMNLTDGLQKGLIKESDLDQHLRKTLKGRFELGMFDPADMLPWAKLGPDVISSEKHDQLATQAARESMVLLENNKAVLPLSKSIRTLAVLGPNADDVELLNGNYGGTPTDEHKHSLLSGIKAAVPDAKIIYHKACELNDEYTTIHHLGDFNNGKGVKVEFWNNKELNGNPDKTDYYNELNFSTFGAWGFAEGINNDNLSVRISGKYTATFTGEMKYTLSTDNGYVLKVNGQVVEENKGGGGRRGFGFGRRGAEYKSFPVEQGKTYDVVIEYRRGNGQFAMLRGDICERKLAEFSELANEVKEADAIIIIGGISARMEGEGGDKQDIELPKVQQMLVQAMHKTGKPVIFVNCSGSAIAFGSVEGQYDALLQAWYPGQGGAKALAEVLFGDYNPGGKLPVTFYRSTQDLPDFLDYSMKNRTYRYFTGKPQYAFGYGLSYTTFKMGKGKLSANAMEKDGTVTLTVPVTNKGKREGTETVQVYVKKLDDAGAPIKALKGFQKLTLQPGETQTATITLDGEAFEYYDESIDELAVKSGRYQILYGTSSRDEDLKSINFTLQ